MVDIRKIQLNDKDTIEAAIGLIKLKRIFRDGLYREQGYKYKTKAQIKMLEEIMKITAYPNAEVRETIGILLGLNPRSVQIWFQNSRQNLTSRRKTERVDTSISVVDIVKIYIDVYNKFQRHPKPTVSYQF